MPRKAKKAIPVEPVQLSFSKELVDRLVPDPMTPQGLDAMFRQLKKALIERALGAEMTEHSWATGAGEAKPQGDTNSCNRRSGKTTITDDGALKIDVPSDREP